MSARIVLAAQNVHVQVVEDCVRDVMEQDIVKDIQSIGILIGRIARKIQEVRKRNPEVKLGRLDAAALGLVEDFKLTVRDLLADSYIESRTSCADDVHKFRKLRSIRNPQVIVAPKVMRKQGFARQKDGTFQ